MDRVEQIKTILKYLKGEHICVLATSTLDGKPEAATMAFSELPDLSVIISTSNSSRKYINLIANPKASVVVGTTFNPFITVQMDGTAREAVGEELENAKAIHTAKNEESRKYANDPNNRYFIVTPNWVRYWDVKANEKFELSF